MKSDFCSHSFVFFIVEKNNSPLKLGIKKCISTTLYERGNDLNTILLAQQARDTPQFHASIKHPFICRQLTFLYFTVRHRGRTFE